MQNNLHLVVDEVVRCSKHRFRMQVWRGEELQPVVLFLGLPGHISPDYYTARLATIALRQHLGYQLPVPVFFHYSVFENKARAFRVDFEVIGHPLRPILTDAKYITVPSDVLERVFSIPSSLQPKDH